MNRKKASDFPREVLQLFDGYVHGALSRREFLDRAAKYAVAGFSAAAMLQALRPNFAWAQQVPKDDARIKAQYVEYPSPEGTGKVRGYLALPANATSKQPGIVVIHENRGLSPYIEDVARRLALENYVALAPDALTPLGGYPHDEEKAAALFAQLDGAKTREDLFAAFPFLREHAATNQRVGAVGFCFGGTTVNAMAARFPGLRAAVPFYGGAPGEAEAAKIRTPIQAHFAGNDARTNAGWPAFEAILKANAVKHEGYIYPNVEHGFHNDTTPRYDEAAAKLAWSRTLEFFKASLR
jgi:carboxymethylenebutenolidase